MFLVILSVLTVIHIPFCGPFVCECVLYCCHRDIGAHFDYPEFSSALLPHF
jgi:hypothetical protein